MDDVAVAPARHKLDRDVYFRMAEAGVFLDNERIELIDGDLIDMAPIGQDHDSAVNALNEALFLACIGRATIWTQSSLSVDRFNVPQPDLAVLVRREDFYRTGDRPAPKDVLLLIEVADSSIRYDRTVKPPLYARAGIADYWIVDIKRQAVDVHRSPAGDAYGEMTTHQAGDRVALALAPDIVVDLSVLFA